MHHNLLFCKVFKQKCKEKRKIYRRGEDEKNTVILILKSKNKGNLKKTKKQCGRFIINLCAKEARSFSIKYIVICLMFYVQDTHLSIVQARKQKEEKCGAHSAENI